MVPFWGRCTTHFSLFWWLDWDVHWGCDLGFDPWPRYVLDGALPCEVETRFVPALSLRTKGSRTKSRHPDFPRTGQTCNEQNPNGGFSSLGTQNGGFPFKPRKQSSLKNVAPINSRLQTSAANKTIAGFDFRLTCGVDVPCKPRVLPGLNIVVFFLVSLQSQGTPQKAPTFFVVFWGPLALISLRLRDPYI